MRNASLAILVLATSTALAGTTSRVSVDASGGESNRSSARPAVSGNGRYVAFSSAASNLVPGDTNDVGDVFVHDTVTGAIERVSVSSSGAEANDWSFDAVLSDDGRLVAFWSGASNLVAGDTNGLSDVFVHDRLLGTTIRGSVDSQGNQCDGSSREPAISSDGRFVAFTSYGTNLVAGDTNGASDIFVRDLLSSTTVRVSVGPGGVEADGAGPGCSLSGTGRFCSFESGASNLVAGDQNAASDVFVHDRDPDGNGIFDEGNGITILASVSTTGAQAERGALYGSISADGRVVAFWSLSSLAPEDTLDDPDVYVRDLQAGTTELITRLPDGSWSGAWNPVISGDGNVVVFDSRMAFVPEDKNARSDVYAYDRSLASYQLMSVAGDGTFATGDSEYPSLSSDGSRVVFQSQATDLVPGDTNNIIDAFLRDWTCPEPAAETYGMGWAGSHGVPVLFAPSGPALCSSIVIALSNSRQAPTLAIMIVGLAPASTPTSLGGTLLVQPLMILPLSLDADGLVTTFDVPCDESVCGLAPHLQALEVDPGASRGVSFSAGLKLVFGN